MERTEVVSSHIKSMGYDLKTRTIEVEYKDGALWQYTPLVPAKFRQAMAAESKGKWVHQNIRNNPAIKAKKVEIEPEK